VHGGHSDGQTSTCAQRGKQMIKHPCEGMTRAQIAAFEAIAINRPPNCSKATIEKLLAGDREPEKEPSFQRRPTALRRRRLLRSCAHSIPMVRMGQREVARQALGRMLQSTATENED
jgi:hypothetical protein